MKIYSIQSYFARNIFSHRPVIKMVLDIENYHNTPTCDIEGFNRKLLDYFPGLAKHFCSLGYEGGFVDRLAEGTYIGHVIEHLTLELQSMMGYQVFYGKTRIIKEPSLYYMVFEYVNNRCGIECGKAAVEIADAICENRVFDLNNIIENLRKITVESDLGPSTGAIYREAQKRGIPVRRVGNESMLQLGTGKHSRFIEAALSDGVSCISVDTAGNKQLTKQILSDYEIPVPPGDIAYTPKSAVELARQIGYPVVVKPYNGNQGKAVTININSDEEVRSACEQAFKYGKAVIVEKFIKGRDYRVLVVGGKVSAVAERRPPAVCGDGIHSIRELVDIQNKNPLRGDDHEKPLTKIKLDDTAKKVLARQGMDEGYIPAENRTVVLRDNANLSTGGTARNCTEELNPYNAQVAIKVAKILGLDIAGIDMTMDDIAKPINLSNGAVIEVNAAPGLRMHLYPSEGEKNDVAGDILDMLFSKNSPHSVPVVSITGTNGKTTTTRLVSHILSLSDKKVGMTSTSGIYVGNECILKGDNTGPVSAGIVLSNKEVEVAVLETARGGIVRKGLGYDLADVGVIVNIAEDHIGLDGLDSLEDLAFAKSLVIEAVKPDGYAVLNADDNMTGYFMKRAAAEVILFSSTSSNPMIQEHLESGGKAVIVKNDAICICSSGRCMHLINIEDIPITIGGMVECNIENSLAAVSALYALGVPAETIRAGLITFKPDAAINPGRFNIFDMGNFKVMLDYSHNPAGYSAVINFIQKLNASRLVGVVGVPGDRLESSMSEVGELCGRSFSKIYVKEDRDLRGREPGEVADILCNAAIKGGMKKENIEVIYDEEKAIETSILDAQPGDLIVVFYEEFEPALQIVNRIRKELQKNLTVTEIDEKQPAEAAQANIQ